MLFFYVFFFCVFYIFFFMCFIIFFKEYGGQKEYFGYNKTDYAFIQKGEAVIIKLDRITCLKNYDIEDFFKFYEMNNYEGVTLEK